MAKLSKAAQIAALQRELVIRQERVAALEAQVDVLVGLLAQRHQSIEQIVLRLDQRLTALAHRVDDVAEIGEG